MGAFATLSFVCLSEDKSIESAIVDRENGSEKDKRHGRTVSHNADFTIGLDPLTGSVASHLMSRLREEPDLQFPLSHLCLRQTSVYVLRGYKYTIYKICSYKFADCQALHYLHRFINYIPHHVLGFSHLTGMYMNTNHRC